ncbi:MAG: HU family DNA-binding protein [Spirochaetota bacterium]
MAAAKKKKEEKKGNPNAAYPTKYTASALVAYVSEKSGISRKDMKQIFEDVFEVIRRGAMKGARVPVGTLGKLFVRVKPAQPERQGRNPLTGETITIKAKPETAVPKFSFNKAFKGIVKAEFKK